MPPTYKAPERPGANAADYSHLRVMLRAETSVFCLCRPDRLSGGKKKRPMLGEGGRHAPPARPVPTDWT